MSMVDVPYPLRGLSERMGFSSQTPNTTPRLKNVRSECPKTRRLRGAQRSGTTRKTPMPVYSGTPSRSKTRRLTSVTFDTRPSTYSAIAPGSEEILWKTRQPAIRSPGTLDPRCVSDFYGNIYCCEAYATVSKYNPDGKKLWSLSVPANAGTDQVHLVEVDNLGNIYIAVSNLGGSGQTTTAIWKYVQYFEEPLAPSNAGDVPELAWELPLSSATGGIGTAPAAGAFVDDMLWKDGVLYTLQTDTATTKTSWLVIYEDIDSGDIAPTFEAVRVVLSTGALGTHFRSRGIGVMSDGSMIVCSSQEDTDQEARFQHVNVDGTVRWTYDGETSDKGGIGYACAIASDDSIYTFGPKRKAGGSTITINKWTDGASAPTNVWGKSIDAPGSSSKHPRILVDKFDNLYVPVDAVSGSAGGVYVYKTDGTLLNQFSVPTSGVPVSVALDPSIPEYISTEPHLAEFIYVESIENATGTPQALRKVRLVTSTPTGGPPRTFVQLVETGGYIRKWSTIAVLDPSGVADDPVNDPAIANPVLSATAPYVDVAIFGPEAFFTDGQSYVVYRAKTDTLHTFKARNAGTIPIRGRFIAQWGSRLMVARLENPQNWAMSAENEPYNWDFFPPFVTSSQAVIGSDSRPGVCPDVITALIPYNDDLLLFGGDHSIQRLSGNPMDGGRFDLMTDVTGMSFGPSWCKDPEGNLYFSGSRGGIYTMTPGSIPIPLSRECTGNRLAAVNFSTYFMQLVWNVADDALHVYQMPFGAGGAAVAQWVWERRADAWGEDFYGESGDAWLQPTFVYVTDSDEPTDRVLLIGREDGHIAAWDANADADDIAPIDSFVDIGPLAGREVAGEMIFSRPQVNLAFDQEGANLELFASDSPDVPGLTKFTQKLRPGRNFYGSGRVRGSSVWMRIRNSALNERWAFESASIEVEPAGMKKVTV